MPIDPEYVRELLLTIDADLDKSPVSELSMPHPDAHKKMLIHLEYMESKGLIDSDFEGSASGIPPVVFVSRITAEGRDFLDAIRDINDYYSYVDGKNDRAAKAASVLGIFVGSVFGGFQNTQQG